MTWKNIIDNNLTKEYFEKAENAKGVYVLYSLKPPYLPFDFAYSLYEIHIRYRIPIKTLETMVRRRTYSRVYKFSLRYVYTEHENFELGIDKSEN